MTAPIQLSQRTWPAAAPEPNSVVSIDGQPTVLANLLVIDFRAETFDRSVTRMERQREQAGTDIGDPPVELAFEAANWLLARLRVMGRAIQVHPVAPDSAPWMARYLTDELEELPAERRVVLSRNGAHVHWELSAVLPTLWQESSTLPDDYTPPPWDGLLMDALYLASNANAAIVLGFAALESFIDEVLDVLAPGTVPQPLWEWMKERNRAEQAPSVQDQFDVLLENFSGHSLKRDQPELWEAFTQLRKARDQVAHGAPAVIGGEAVTSRHAARLVMQAGEMMAWIEQFLPVERRRPTLTPTEMELTMMVHQPEGTS